MNLTMPYNAPDDKRRLHNMTEAEYGHAQISEDAGF